MSFKERIDWPTISDAGLRGGIMVTGSVGSGKSVATLLPWFEQLIEFDPFPSFFIGDPKCTFAEEIIKMVEKRGLSDRLVHLSLDGNVKWNPIYREKMLQNGGFAEVGQMIRSAQLNFLGKESGDGKFWGSKANDLVKNVLRFCAGLHGDYFTLIDFYSVLIEANEFDFELAIHKLIEKGNFNEEEVENLKFTKQYFENEFKSMDEKMVSGIVSTATTFLSQLMEYQSSKLICPKKEEVNFWSFDEIVDTGKIFILDIRNEGLARPIGTIAKQQYQHSVLGRNRCPIRRKNNKRLAVSIIDEYPLMSTFSSGGSLGDDTYRAVGRSAGAVDIYAMQGHSSLYSISDKEACDTLLLNFRTHISLHSLDSKTADFFKRIGGEEFYEQETESFSESGNNARADLVSGNLLTKNTSVSRTVSRSLQKKPRVDGKYLASLNSFEAVGLIFKDGVETEFIDNLSLKPHFLEKKETPHEVVLNKVRGERPKSGFFSKLFGLVACLTIFFLAKPAYSFPTVCSVVNTPQFEKILDLKISGCMCGGVPPRPCMRVSYYLPFQYLEVRPDSSSLFRGLPGAELQLASVSDGILESGGIGDSGGYFYNARTLTIPFVSLSLGRLPCGGAPTDKMCFDAVSEHLGRNWKMPIGDHLQPKFLVWQAAGPKLCHLKGAASSATGSPAPYNPGSPMCSVPLEFVTKYPPTPEPVCTGWGQLIPRTGFVDGVSTINASLLAGARFRSLAGEIFRSSPSSPDEKWQMIYPNSSGAFRRGQNLSWVAINQANERGRVGFGKERGYLYAIWKKVSCCRDYTSAVELAAVVAYSKAICAGLK